MSKYLIKKLLNSSSLLGSLYFRIHWQRLSHSYMAPSAGLSACFRSPMFITGLVIFIEGQTQWCQPSQYCSSQETAGAKCPWGNLGVTLLLLILNQEMFWFNSLSDFSKGLRILGKNKNLFFNLSLKIKSESRNKKKSLSKPIILSYRKKSNSFLWSYRPVLSNGNFSDRKCSKLQAVQYRSLWPCVAEHLKWG